MHGAIWRSNKKDDDRRHGTSTITDTFATVGLENLQKYTLAAMQSEITTLKRELKKHEKVMNDVHV